MRITNNMMTANLLYNVNKNLEYMSKKQDELATGKRIHRPSDDPVLASKVLARRTDLSELEQYDKNTRDALGWMEITEKAIEDNGNVLQRIRELTVQAANGTNTAEDTQKIKLEVESLKTQLVSNANSTFAGRYIFSGFETDEKFLNDDGSFNIDVDKYSIDNRQVVKYEVGVGESIDVMTSGLDLYGYVESSNVLTTGFTDATTTGTASSYSYVSGTFDRSLDHSGSNLNLDINGTVYNVDETLLNGSVSPLTEKEVIDIYKNADDGFGNLLSSVANVSFDADGGLLVTSKVLGPIAITPQSGVTFFAPANGGMSFTGANLVEVSLSSSAYGDPTLPLSQSEIDILANEPLRIDVNGTSVELKPRDTALFTTLNEYVTEMNNVIDKELGVGKLPMSVDIAGVITFTTQNTEPFVEPSLSVGFPKYKAGFPSGTNTGISATRSSLSGTIDFSADYSGTNLNLSIGGVNYTVDTTNLDGTLNKFSKTDIIEAYQNAVDGGGNPLDDVANILFDSNDRLVIEVDTFGATVMAPLAAGTYFDPANGGTVYSGVASTEATISGLPLGDPTLPLIQEDIEAMRNNSLSIVVNSISKTIRPSASTPINTLNDYVAEMNTQLTKEFGAGNVLMSVDALGVITVATTGTVDSKVPSISIDFDRSHKSELIEDIDQLIGFLETGDHDELSSMIKTIDGHLSNMLALRADVGARTNRLDLISMKIASNNISFTQLLSDAEDADMSEVIMLLKNAENVYQASLSTGARIIQPSLVDFLR
ncbi:MAG: flagellar hook-associated protein FlgL [Clostridiales bacterium]|nr:flagellar hook-associated protein FlgL [Clostridiales bacterium]